MKRALSDNPGFYDDHRSDVVRPKRVNAVRGRKKLWKLWEDLFSSPSVKEEARKWMTEHLQVVTLPSKEDALKRVIYHGTSATEEVAREGFIPRGPAYFTANPLAAFEYSDSPTGDPGSFVMEYRLETDIELFYVPFPLDVLEKLNNLLEKNGFTPLDDDAEYIEGAFVQLDAVGWITCSDGNECHEKEYEELMLTRPERYLSFLNAVRVFGKLADSEWREQEVEKYAWDLSSEPSAFDGKLHGGKRFCGDLESSSA